MKEKTKSHPSTLQEVSVITWLGTEEPSEETTTYGGYRPV